MKLTYLLLILLLSSCGTIKQPSVKQTSELLTQVLKDVAAEEKFMTVNIYRIADEEFMNTIYNPYDQVDFEYFYEKNYLIFNHFSKCNDQLNEIFNVKNHKEYYYQQTLLDNGVLEKLINKENRDSSKNKNTDYLKISRPFFSPKKDVAIVLVYSNLIEGGVLKIYELKAKRWNHTCSFQSIIF